jgi:hypothetical protein
MAAKDTLFRTAIQRSYQVQAARRPIWLWPRHKRLREPCYKKIMMTVMASCRLPQTRVQEKNSFWLKALPEAFKEKSGSRSID